jgi:hypothetical protein
MINASFVGILFGLYFQVLILVPLTLSAIVYCDIAEMCGGNGAATALLRWSSRSSRCRAVT